MNDTMIQYTAGLQFRKLLERGDLHDDTPTLVEDMVVVSFGEDVWNKINTLVQQMIREYEHGTG